MVLTLTESIIFQSLPEKQIEIQVSEKRFRSRHFLDWKMYNALNFELKPYQFARFGKIVCIQKILFWFILLRENEIFPFFLLF